MKVLNVNTDVVPAPDEALRLLSLEGPAVLDLFAAASRIREKFKGREVKLCSIINGKSGLCPEDCAFCSQSARFRTNIPSYPLLSPDAILERAIQMKSHGARKFSIVTSGYNLSVEELDTIKKAVRLIKEKAGLGACASLGDLSMEELLSLKEAGLDKYHHNLETAQSFFPEIVTTHSYDDKVGVVRRAQEAGLEVCSGGIFGMGESHAQRVEMLMALKALNVDSIPINFLNPIPGTPLEGRNDLMPMECLKIISVARFLMPDKDILICGGREVNLRGLQSLMFFAGANGLMIGGYLTTKGRPEEEDLNLIKDLGLSPCNS